MIYIYLFDFNKLKQVLGESNCLEGLLITTALGIEMPEIPKEKLKQIKYTLNLYS